MTDRIEARCENYIKHRVIGIAEHIRDIIEAQIVHELARTLVHIAAHRASEMLAAFAR